MITIKNLNNFKKKLIEKKELDAIDCIIKYIQYDNDFCYNEYRYLMRDIDNTRFYLYVEINNLPVKIFNSPIGVSMLNNYKNKKIITKLMKNIIRNDPSFRILS